MVDYEMAIKRPFSDLKKLLIGIVIAMFPIINFASLGYAMEASPVYNAGKAPRTKKRSRRAPKAALPEWDNVVQQWVKGLAAAAITVLYMVPAFMIMMLGMGVLLGDILGILTTYNGGFIPGTQSETSMLVRNIVQENWHLVIPAIFKSAPIFMVAFLVVLFTIYILPMAIVHYIAKGGFNSAFQMSEITRRAFTSEYLIAWLVVVVLKLVSSPLALIPWIGAAARQFLIWMVAYNIYGQVYKKLK